MRTAFLSLALVAAFPARAEQVEPVRVIRPQEIIAPEDVVLRSGPQSSSVTLDAVIGREARVALYPGRPIRAGDIGTPAVIERNQLVPLVYVRGGLRIETEGRALVRAGPGEFVRVMNLSSRATVTGRVTKTGRVEVFR